MFRTSSAVLIGLMGGLSVSSVQAASLTDEVTVLVENSPRIEAARNNLRAAEKGMEEAFGDYLPRVDLKVDAGHIYADAPVRRSANQGNYAAGRESATLTLTQKIWDGGAREAEYETASLATRCRRRRVAGNPAGGHS